MSAGIGPAATPDSLADPTPPSPLIARRRGPFVSRGDSSGTHVNELAQWHAAGASVPPGPWYVESGADQATTLHLADERDAYALADLPTFTKLAGLRLRFVDSIRAESTH